MNTLFKLYTLIYFLFIPLLALASIQSDAAGDPKKNFWPCNGQAKPIRLLKPWLKLDHPLWTRLWLALLPLMWLLGSILIIGSTSGAVRLVAGALTGAVLLGGGVSLMSSSRAPGAWAMGLMGVAMVYNFYFMPEHWSPSRAGPLATTASWAILLVVLGFLLAIATVKGNLSAPVGRRWPRLWPIADGLGLAGALLGLAVALLQLLGLFMD